MANSPKLQWPYPNRDSDPWFDQFEDFVSAADASVYSTREDRQLVLAGGGTISFTAPTLSWSSALTIYSPLSGYYMQIPAGSVTVNVGQSVYIELVRGMTDNRTVTALVANSTPNTDAAFAIAVRDGAAVVFRNGFRVSSGSSAQMGSGSTALPLSAKGDLVIGNASGGATRLPVGANDTVLIADSSQTSGVKWGTLGTSSNVGNQLVLRGANGEFSAGSITASTLTLTGNQIKDAGATARIDIPNLGTTTLYGEVADGASAIGVVLDNYTALATSGSKLLSIRNAGVEKAFVDRNGGFQGTTLYSGGFVYAGSGFAANGLTNVSLVGRVADSANAIGAVINNTASLFTPGAKIVSFQNAGDEKAFVHNDGYFYSAQGFALMSNFTAKVSLAAGTGIFIRGAPVDGVGAIACRIGSFNTLDTAGAKICSFYNDNGATEKAYISKDGTIFGVSSVIAGTNLLTNSGVVQRNATAGALSINGTNTDGASAVGVILNNTVSLTTSGAKLASFRNAGVEKAFVDKDGGLTAFTLSLNSGSGIFSAGGLPVSLRGNVASGGAQGPATKIGNLVALNGASDIVCAFYKDSFATQIATVHADGTVESKGGGFMFPDGTVQATAVVAGSGTLVGGSAIHTGSSYVVPKATEPALTFDTVEYGAF